jgi:hypothetical protein
MPLGIALYMPRQTDQPTEAWVWAFWGDYPWAPSEKGYRKEGVLGKEL